MRILISLLLVMAIVFFLYKSLLVAKDKHSIKKQGGQVNVLEQQLDKDVDQYQKKLNDALNQSGASN